jgi:hypothetical protein
MRRRISLYLALLTAVLVASSCTWDPPMFDYADSFIAFPAAASSAAEEGGTAGIPVLVTTDLNAPAVSVTFEFDESSTAVEGTHFTLVNQDKTLDISEGWGYDTIWIQPVDNEIFTGNLVLIINLVSNTRDYPFGVQSSHTLTIVDDEHPLGDWIGSFTVSAVDYASVFGPETWEVTTTSDPDDYKNLIVTGIGSGYSEYTSITGVVDLEEKTITFAPGSEIGTHSLYDGPLAIFLGDAEGNLYEEPIVGEIRDDGSIFVDFLGIKFVGGINEGLAWGVYATTWSPAGKKAAKLMLQP